MKLFRAILGYAIAGILVMSVWGGFSDAAGFIGGYAGAIVLIGPLWFMNHYLNLVNNKSNAAFVDMGLAIAVCGIFRDLFTHGMTSLIQSMPTIILVILGGALGGIIASAVEKDMAKDLEQMKNCKEKKP